MGFGSVFHISIENHFCVFFPHLKISRGSNVVADSIDLTDKHNLFVLAEAISTSVEG